jgi:hypothetical protein
MAEQPRTSSTTVQGEGDKAADRTYRDAATRHAESADTTREARDAEEALEGQEGEELARAEREG